MFKAMVLKVLEPALSGDWLEMRFLGPAPELLNQKHTLWFCKPSGGFSCIIKCEHYRLKEICDERQGHAVRAATYAVLHLARRGHSDLPTPEVPSWAWGTRVLLLSSWDGAAPIP